MSGADDAASIAERRKLQAQLLEAQEDLDSSYRNHSLDARADALDEELEAYQDASDNYIQSLRDNLEDVDSMIESVMTDVVNNADLVLQNLVKISEEYGVTLTNDLKDPWVKTSEQVALTKNDIDTMLDATQVSIGVFTTSVNSTIDQMYVRMQQTSSDFTAYLGAPYKNVTASGGPINTFSTKTESALKNAVDKAKSAATEMTTSNKKPWNDGVTAINTWSKSVENAYNKAIQKAREYEAAVNRTQHVGGPSYYSGVSNGGGGGNNPPKTTPTTTTQKKSNPDVKALQEILNDAFHANIFEDGIWRQGTKTALMNAERTMRTALNGNWIAVDGKYDSNTRNAMVAYFNNEINKLSKSSDPRVSTGINWYRGYIKKLPTNYSSFYAKGTLGTKKDQWAITDEYGPELTMYATPEGTLSYMRAGSTVVPANETKKILEIVDNYNPDMMNNNVVRPFINNVVTNNNASISLNFESFIKAENITDATMGDLNNMIDKKINDFSRSLNYALKKFK